MEEEVHVRIEFKFGRVFIGIELSADVRQEHRVLWRRESNRERIRNITTEMSTPEHLILP